MLFGQAGTEEEGGLLDSITASIGTQFDKAVGAIKEASLPWSDPTGDAPGTVATAKGTSRRTTVEPSPEGEPLAATGTSSIWPWVIGLALVGGGVYWFTKGRKRSKKGK